MKVQTIIGVSLLGMSVATYFKDEKGDVLGSIGDFFTNSNSSDNINLDTATDKQNETKKSQKTTDTTNSTSSEDFAFFLAKDNYISHHNSSSSKKTKRTYEHNKDLKFMTIKDNKKIVGGFDLKQKQSISKKQAKFLDNNKNNSFMKMIRGFKK